MIMQTAIDQLFDEADYLTRYDDVRRAVAARHETSGRAHYLRVGHREGRLIKGFDAPFYLRSYPLAAREIAQGKADSAFEHYVAYGRGRGYIPHPAAPRVDNPAAIGNRFGGFWTDQLDAPDLIQGKLDMGHITAAQAEQLRFWTVNGYVVIPNAIPASLLEAAVYDFDLCYSGQLPGIMFECQEVIKSRLPSPWQRAMNEHPTKALDIHFHSAAIRDMIFAPEIEKFIGLLFNAPAFASQSLGFYIGSAQEGHQDSAYVAYTNPRQFLASWIALEDVTIGGGELFYYPGSQNFDNFLYGGRYKSFHESMRLGNNEFPSGEVGRHVRSLAERTEQAGMPRQLFAAKKGDALIWHADLVHGGNPVNPGVTRKSVVTHYCSQYAAPLYAENRETAVHRHGKHSYSTCYYLYTQPATGYRRRPG